MRLVFSRTYVAVDSRLRGWQLLFPGTRFGYSRRALVFAERIPISWNSAAETTAEEHHFLIAKVRIHLRSDVIEQCLTELREFSLKVVGEAH